MTILILPSTFMTRTLKGGGARHKCCIPGKQATWERRRLARTSQVRLDSLITGVVREPPGNIQIPGAGNSPAQSFIPWFLNVPPTAVNLPCLRIACPICRFPAATTTLFYSAHNMPITAARETFL